MDEQVILVDEKDNPIGIMEKMEAHRKGALHRAFSIFIFNNKGELLLQQRALDKYHSGGKWTNTCCSHPRPNEKTIDAAQRRLQEEMGMSCDLTFNFQFQYKAEFNNGLIEHEIDHVFFGKSDSLPILNPNEVESYQYKTLIGIKKDIQQNPEEFTPWFKICFDQVLERSNNKSQINSL